MLTLQNILTTKVHNQRLFYNFDVLKNYYDYSLHIQMTKMTIYLFKKGMYKFKKMISFCDFVISERLCLF